jgi:hypothetical protein
MSDYTSQVIFRDTDGRVKAARYLPTSPPRPGSTSTPTRTSRPAGTRTCSGSSTCSPLIFPRPPDTAGERERPDTSQGCRGVLVVPGSEVADAPDLRQRHVRTLRSRIEPIMAGSMRHRDPTATARTWGTAWDTQPHGGTFSRIVRDG